MLDSLKSNTYSGKMVILKMIDCFYKVHCLRRNVYVLMSFLTSYKLTPAFDVPQSMSYCSWWNKKKIVLTFIYQLVCPAFDWRSRGPWLESYAGLTEFLRAQESPSLHSTKVWFRTPRGRCLCEFDIPGRRMLAAHKNRDWNSFPMETRLVS